MSRVKLDEEWNISVIQSGICAQEVSRDFKIKIRSGVVGGSEYTAIARDSVSKRFRVVERRDRKRRANCPSQYMQTTQLILLR